MGTEIERKYLVKTEKWRSHLQELLQNSPEIGAKYCQGYIPTDNGTTVRLRTVGSQGYLTIKSKTEGYTRSEFEYPIPVQDARQMLETLCLKPLIEKIRYTINYGNLTWEVDDFLGENKGLIVAEVELENENQAIDIPRWIDREVNDIKYFNSSLIKYPYSQWKKNEKYQATDN
ncbi:MAG: CYTH domain-containing protein [Pleurocapsa sp.]